MKPDRKFRVGVLIVTLLIAGGLSYLSSPSPDGLDSTTLRGCEIVDHDGSEQLVGQCIAQDAREHALAGSPMADYTVGGAEGTGGVAGVAGVAVTLAVAVALFWLLARSPNRTQSTATPSPTDHGP